MKTYHAYLFDMDGTLVNSEPLKGKALALACLDFGVNIDAAIYKEVMGKSWHIVTEYFFRRANIHPPIAEFDLHFKKHYQKLLDERLEANLGVREYLTYLRQKGYKCALVTSSKYWAVELILDALQLQDFFDVIVTQENVQHHKPDPEAYLVALSKLDVSAADALVFEDSHSGVLAATASSCDVVGFQHDFNRHNDLSAVSKLINNFSEMIEKS
ncbi:HAD family phosphatase [Vibrio natriegens]|uniref:HAD family hydrolase n=1 Tax=Vibrio natriegens TaxID=691 RepID=UPI0021E7E640|nr:HAD family phosphatase [Vibrio natriegens]UYI50074.1 HAD family phosphatase [Vibrio natriegens]